MKKYEGKVNHNAGIEIRYGKDKPEVSFFYPNKKSIMPNGMLGNIRATMLTLWAIGALTATLLMEGREIIILTCIGYLLTYIILPTVIYYLFKEKWDKMLPKYEAFFCKLLGYKKVMRFNKNNTKRKYIEIPLFANVLLDYKAKKDFAKQLIKIKIKEYKFKVYKENKFEFNNEHMWWARFYFKKVPKDGSLKVEFI